MKKCKVVNDWCDIDLRRDPLICRECKRLYGFLEEPLDKYYSPSAVPENESAHKRAHSGNWLSRMLNFEGWNSQKETQKGLLSAFLQVLTSKLACYILRITYYLAFIANFDAIASFLTLYHQNLHFSFTEDVVGVVFS